MREAKKAEARAAWADALGGLISDLDETLPEIDRVMRPAAGGELPQGGGEDGPKS